MQLVDQKLNVFVKEVGGIRISNLKNLLTELEVADPKYDIVAVEISR